MNGKVVEIPPAKFNETYHGHRIAYVFDPELRMWSWEFHVPLNTIRFHNTADTRQAAIKAAHKMVDKL